jgi:hypothetical protein
LCPHNGKFAGETHKQTAAEEEEEERKRKKVGWHCYCALYEFSGDS